MTTRTRSQAERRYRIFKAVYPWLLMAMGATAGAIIGWWALPGVILAAGFTALVDRFVK